MQTTKTPFNVSILKLSPDRLRFIRPITTFDYYERANGDLHPDGLFSIDIFGRMGDERRDQTFSYIDTKIEVFHPTIYQTLVKLKNLYKGIIEGTGYAVWDDTLKDFVASNELDGSTGYAFFVKHWKNIEFKRNQSLIRNARIDLIEKYKDVALQSKWLVLPAGLRDIEVDADGRKKIDVINDHYQKMFSAAATITPNDHLESETYDRTRLMIHRALGEVHAYIEQMLTGKNGFFLSKWGSRKVFNSTRNVISAMVDFKTDLGDSHGIRFTDTVVGLYQALKATQPLAIHEIRTRYLSQVFMSDSLTANLIDPVTLKSVSVDLTADEYDQWTSVEGLEKLLTNFSEPSIRHRPVMVRDHYLALLYIPPDSDVVKVFHSIDELPEGFDRNYVRPIRLDELLYMSCAEMFRSRTGTATRYPVLGIGGIYSTTYYIKTTLVGQRRYELDHNWERSDNLLLEFPIHPTDGELPNYQDVAAVNPSRLGLLGGDCKTVRY